MSKAGEEIRNFKARIELAKTFNESLESMAIEIPEFAEEYRKKWGLDLELVKGYLVQVSKGYSPDTPKKGRQKSKVPFTIEELEFDAKLLFTLEKKGFNISYAKSELECLGNGEFVYPPEEDTQEQKKQRYDGLHIKEKFRLRGVKFRGNRY